MEVPGAKTGEVMETVEGVEGRRVVAIGEYGVGVGEMGEESAAEDRGERRGCGCGCGLGCWDWDSGSDSGSMLSLKPLEVDELGGSCSGSTLSRKP